MRRRPRVLLLRGHSANPWELGAWELLTDRYEIQVAMTRSNRYDIGRLSLARRDVGAIRDFLPRGRIGGMATIAIGDRYLGLGKALAGVDIVHSAELGVWWSGQPAALKRAQGFKLVLTCWETIPFRDTYRRFRGRADRRRALAETDLFLAPTERARQCLLLEGASPERVVVAPPGIDTGRFGGGRPSAGDGHLVVSPGRLVWEKGHFDVIRAVASLRDESCVRVLIVGAGPEEDRLRRYAADLGVADRVEVRALPYEAMPDVFASASCVVLGSLAIPYWEEQFGMVLAEAIAAGAPIIASTSGAIPEVLGGTGALLYSPGDWPTLACLLADGPLAASPGGRYAYPAAVVRRYSNEAAAERLAEAYESVLGADGGGRGSVV
jgi:glycosyltransferase involved in cell wall biosynthesis